MGLLALAAPMAAQADAHIYSYDASSPAARTLAPTGLSFEFNKPPLGSPVVTRIIQTGERGSAGLKPASDTALGPGGLKAALDREPAAGRLYEIEPEGDGSAFINAVCPGARRAWLVIGRLDRFKDLKVQAVGRDEGAAHARLCVTLELGFRNDWTLPQRTPPKPRFERTGPL
jgi:hypothetical protein